MRRVPWFEIVTAAALLILFLVFFVRVANAQGYDLPLEPPRLGQARDSQLPEADNDDGDDPRDTPPPTIYGEEIDAEGDTVIYVLDVSTSMYMRSGGTQRITAAMDELQRSISGLAASFRFNVMTYSCRVDEWRPGLSEATEANKTSALQWCNRWASWGQGMTGTGPALALALSNRENRTIVLLTDGAPNCGAPGPDYDDLSRQHREIVRSNNAQGAVINVFGIKAMWPLFRGFCQAVAADSGGVYVDVP